MSSDPVYIELKPQMQLVADALFAASENLLRKHGNFIPNGAVLTGEGKVRYVLAAPDNADDSTTSLEVLPLLHDLLRSETSKTQATATGVAENVNIKREGQKPTDAIKVLFEHQKGLTVALYLPFKKKLFGGYVLGEVFSRTAEPEVNAFVFGHV